MYVEIVTPEKVVFAGEADLVQLPGSNGSFEVLKNHAPLISTLATGTIKIIDKDENKHYFEVNGGVVEALKNNIVVLSESV